jgi:hypothetical protein
MVLAMASIRPETPHAGNGNGNRPGFSVNGGVGKMTLVEAAWLVERLQSRAAHAGELEALRIARDALLTIVSEGFVTLGDRLRADGCPVQPREASAESGTAAAEPVVGDPQPQGR